MPKQPLRYRIKNLYLDLSMENRKRFMKEVSEQMGVTPQMLYYIMNQEHGQGRGATAEQLQVIAKWFDITIEELLIPAPAGSISA